jgi:two-component sensor histidine kinase
MVFYIFRINSKIRKREQELEFKNLKIQTQNNTIQNSLKEKDLLIKEVHHRVKNNLQLIISIINLQKSKGVTTETQSILDDLKYRIFSISNAHQMLYQRNSVQSVNIKDYLISILQNLESTSEKPIQLDYSFENSDDIFMGLDNAILLGLLINEMFTNSLKYAFKEGKSTQIKLHFYKDPYRDKFKMTYSDNGPGLSDTFENIIQKNQSTGLELIYMLVQNLSGKLSVNSQNGLEYVLEFEIQSKPSDAS